MRQSVVSPALLLAVVSLGVLVVPAIGLAEEEATVTLEIESEGDDRVVAILETTASDAAGYETTIDYDPSVLTFQDVEGVDLDTPVTNSDEDNGSVRLVQAQGSGVERPTLARLTFAVEESGYSELSPVQEETLVNDENRTLLDVTTVGTSIGEEPTDEESPSSNGEDTTQTDDETDTDEPDDGGQATAPDQDGDANDAPDDSDEDPTSPGLAVGVGIGILVLGALVVAIARVTGTSPVG